MYKIKRTEQHCVSMVAMRKLRNGLRQVQVSLAIRQKNYMRRFLAQEKKHEEGRRTMNDRTEELNEILNKIANRESFEYNDRGLIFRHRPYVNVDGENKWKMDIQERDGSWTMMEDETSLSEMKNLFKNIVK